MSKEQPTLFPELVPFQAQPPEDHTYVRTRRETGRGLLEMIPRTS